MHISPPLKYLNPNRKFIPNLSLYDPSKVDIKSLEISSGDMEKEMDKGNRQL
jgi:hypothetical protein